MLNALTALGETVSAYPSFVRKAGVSMVHADASAMADHLSGMSKSLFDVFSNTVSLHKRAERICKRRGLAYALDPMEKDG